MENREEELIQCVEELKEQFRGDAPFLTEGELMACSCIIISVAGTLQPLVQSKEQEDNVVAFLDAIRKNLGVLIRATEDRMRESIKLQEIVDGKPK